MGKVKAIILVGGPSLGTRFRPLSLTVPKPLFPIGGAPLLYHHLKACSTVPNLLEVLLIGFFPSFLLDDFIKNTAIELNLKIRYLQEASRLGTAGGLQSFKAEILENLEEDSQLLILHGDILCSFPLNQLLEEHTKNNHFCTILTKKFSTPTYRNFGCIVEDKNTHEVLHYAEKPETFVNDLVNCGVYAFQLELFEHLSSAFLRKESEKDSSIYDIFKSFEYQSDSEVIIQIEQDILKDLAGKQKIYSHQTNDYWLQIKHPLSALKGSQLLFETNTIELQPKKAGQIIGNVFIHKGVVEVDPSAVLGPNVTLCKGVRVGPGVRIRNSIILDNVEIKDHACIINSIVGWNSTVAQWDRIEGNIVDDNNNDAYDSNGYGGITIFAEGVKTGPEICIRNCIVLPHKELYQNYSNSILL